MSVTTETLLLSLREFFSDTSRSPQDTLSGLKEIRDTAEELIAAIEDDLTQANVDEAWSEGNNHG